MNIFYPPNQECLFGIMLVLGIFLGVFYDVLSVKRKLLGDYFVVVLIDDIIFVVVSAVAFLLTVFVANNGVVRWFEVCFCLFGLLLYKSSVSRIVMPIMAKIAQFIRNTIKRLLLMLLFLLSILLRPIFCAVLFVEKKLLKPLVLLKYIIYKQVQKKRMFSARRLVCR